MSLLTTGLILFLGVHSISILASGWRDRMLERLGRGLWMGLYSIVAAIGLYLIIRGYGEARNQTVILYQFGRWMHGVSTVLMLPVFPLLIAAYLPGSIRTAAKHPMLVAVKLWALAHLLANGSLADVVLFGTLLTWAVADRISLKRRPARSVPSLRPGPYNDLIAVIAGIAIYGFMLNFGHELLIGMPLVLR